MGRAVLSMLYIFFASWLKPPDKEGIVDTAASPHFIFDSDLTAALSKALSSQSDSVKELAIFRKSA